MSVTKIALLGNPNVGKSSLFNLLSGLKQKTGNYPGITVDVSKGFYEYNDETFELIDFPGVYSIYPNSKDEELVFDILLNATHQDYPDKVMLVADPFNIKRSLLLYFQIVDLGFPTLLVFNFEDSLSKKGISWDIQKIEEQFHKPICLVSSRKKEHEILLKEALSDLMDEPSSPTFEIPIQYKKVVENIHSQHPSHTNYEIWTALAQNKEALIPVDLREDIVPYHQEHKIVPKRLQVVETVRRYKEIDAYLPSFQESPDKKHNHSVSDKIDSIVLHPILGYGIFFIVLFVIFQCMFYLSQFPMDMIDSVFVSLSEGVQNTLPEGPLQDLLANGIIPGIGGIIVFVPLIAILFFILLILEEIGYMSRVVFLMDRWLKPLGLSGKSVVPLISGVACAIPALMSARNIENEKERLITRLVTPFMTCSARLPVYAIIIALIIPKGNWGVFDQRAMVMMLMYLIGVAMALFSAFILKLFIKSTYKSYLVMDMPSYKAPIFKNIVLGVWRKCLDFVLGAGKIILAFSIILWVLGTFGPKTEFRSDLTYNSIPLKESFLGKFGQSIEPVIKPLGYDWKIGVGLISSFAAREVFVSTLATIYSIEGDEQTQEMKLTEKLKNEKDEQTGNPIFNFATGVSLLLFYAFAMQCMSTVATLKKETNGWKWPIIQTIGMTAIAYICSLIAYQILK